MRSTLQTLARYHSVKNMEEYKSIVSGLKTPYVVDFTASWCGPCKMLWPVLEKREAEASGKWTIIKVDVDLEELSEVVNDHSVSGVPTLAFYKGNQKLFQRSGYVDDAGFKKLEAQYLV